MNAFIQPYRRSFWETHHVIEKQGDSDPFPFLHIENWYESFIKKDVLEIGPGDGRQMFILATMANTYSIADISDVVLKKHQNTAANTFLINTWDDNFERSFDTICLWYVFHHVLDTEFESFVSFLSRHLKENGSLVFNVPTSGQVNPDATNTTPYVINEFKAKMLKLNYETEHEFDQKYNNYVFKMVKIQRTKINMSKQIHLALS